MYFDCIIIIFIYLVPDFVEAFCPISRHINTSSDFLYHYPSIYFSDHLNISQLPDSYNCTGNGDEEPLKCVSGNQLCPVKNKLVDIFLQKFRNVTSYECNIASLNRLLLTSNKHDNISLNIIIFGGSVASGNGLFPYCCYCSKNKDTKCNKTVEEFPNYQKDPPSDQCNYVGYFSKWIKNRHPYININLYNLANSGAESSWSLNSFHELVKRIPTITPNDIIFIDHSTNDGRSMKNPRGLNFRIAMESLVRQIYAHYNNHWPNIIILENHAFFRDVSSDPPPTNDYEDYSTAYRDVAAYYHIPIMSLRDIVWSEYLTTNLPQLSHYFRTMMGVHPYWHTHLFLSDLIAASLLDIMHKCDHLAKGNKLPVMSPLPERLYNASTYEQKYLCNNDLPFLLSVSPSPSSSNVYTPTNLTDYELHPPESEGWRTYVDYHHVPGWMINKYSNPLHRHLTFPMASLPSSSSSSSSSSPSTKPYTNYRLKIEFLKTYKNAGMAQISICGIVLPQLLDSLWEDPRSSLNHFSIPNYYIVDFTEEIHKKCSSVSESERVLDIEYLPGKHTKQDFKSFWADEKVKIMNIKICHKR